jgi:uncharacterized protein (DUF2252 family)
MTAELETTPESPEARARLGREARRRVAPETHARLETTEERGAVAVVAAQIPPRLPELVPLRHARMAASPFAFFRGAAAVMAADLARTPTSGLTAQLCGDAHLSNFGMFASPERRLVFDINDFDETIRGPWEWDLKRLAASLVVAGRENSFTDKQIRRAVWATVARYRSAMATFAAMGNLDVWYAHADIEEVQQHLSGDLTKQMSRRLDKAVAKARVRDHRHSLTKLTEVVDGRRRIVGVPPIVVPLTDLVAGMRRDEIESTVRRLLEDYTESLQPGPRELVRSYRFVDMARKVVGVGSVGTRCWIVLLRGRDDSDPLFLQVKEALPSALAEHLDVPRHGHEGTRVVTGQRLMQATGDPFLGWQRTTGLDGRTRDFYVRQLHDWKGSAVIERMVPKGMRLYGQLCAWSLARAHARTGDRIAISAYLGEDDRFLHAVTDFAHAYADLNESDHRAFRDAVERGLLASLDTSAER